MSKIVIFGNEPLTGSVVAYVQIDGRSEMKLKYDDLPFQLDVEPGRHSIALNTLSPFRRNSGRGGDGLSVATSILNNMTDDSWEGTVTLPDQDDVLFVYCESKFKNQFHLKVIKEAELESTLSSYTSAAGKTKKRGIAGKIIIGFVALSVLVSILTNAFYGKRVSEKSVSADPSDASLATDISNAGELIPEPETPENSEIGENQAVPYYVSDPAGLRLRSAPTTESGIVVEMPYRSEIEVFEVENGWARAKFGEYSGYCAAEYISPGSGKSDVSNTGILGKWYIYDFNEVRKYEFQDNGKFTWSFTGFLPSLENYPDCYSYCGYNWYPAGGEYFAGNYTFYDGILTLDYEDSHVGKTHEEIRVNISGDSLMMDSIRYDSEFGASSNAVHGTYKRLNMSRVFETAAMVGNTLNIYRYSLNGDGTFEYICRDYQNYYYDHLDNRTDWAWFASPHGCESEYGTYNVTDEKITFHFNGNEEFGFTKRDESFDLKMFLMMSTICEGTDGNDRIQSIYENLKKIESDFNLFS